MEKFVYRCAQIDDLDSILKLGNLLVDFEITDNSHFFWDKNTLQKCIEDPTAGLIVCALIDNELAGFSIVQYNLVFGIATIDQLFILPKYRNCGLGKNLYNLIIDNVKNIGINEICMNVEFNNKSVIDFFEHNGFEKTMNNVILKMQLN